jgi:uncharacterized protein YbjT (DUF2867 family)
VGIALGQLVAPLLVGPLRRYRPIAADAVALAMVRAAKSGQTGVRIYTSEEIARSM